MTDQLPNLRLGYVVTSVEDGARGQVEWVQGQPSIHFPTIRGDLYAVRLSAGIHRCGNMVEGWEYVSDNQWTREEKARFVGITWTPPDWYDEGDRIQDCDSFEFALLAALYTETDDHRLDLPSSVYEMALAVAQQIDERTELVGSAFLGEMP